MATTTTGRSPGATSDVPIDLRDPGQVLWAALAVPDDWQEIARLSEEVAADLDPLVERTVAAIVGELSAYRRGIVPLDDLTASVQRSMAAILIGLAEHRGPTPDELAVRRELGARRALQGLDIDALIAGFHLGYRELWLTLVAALPDDDADATLQLLTAATTVWQWVHEITDALSGAHASTVRALEARAVGNRQRFVELVVGGDLDGDEATRLATGLGFDPRGPFVATVVRGATDDLDAVALQRALETLPGRHAAVVRGPLLVVLGQAADARPGSGPGSGACSGTRPGRTTGTGSSVPVAPWLRRVASGSAHRGRACTAPATASRMHAARWPSRRTGPPPGSTTSGSGPR